MAGVPDLDAPIADVHGQRGQGGEGGRAAGDVAPVRHRVPERRAAVDDGVDEQPGAGVRVADDDGGRRQQAVAVGVIAVQVGVDGDGDRRVGADPSSAVRKARVRRSVAQVSTTTTPSAVTTAPALLTHHDPSGWTQAWTPSATMCRLGSRVAHRRGPFVVPGCSVPVTLRRTTVTRRRAGAESDGPPRSGSSMRFPPGSATYDRTPAPARHAGLAPGGPIAHADADADADADANPARSSAARGWRPSA